LSASTPYRFSRRAAALTAVALAVTAVAGCGRRGDLEAPNAAAVQSPAKSELSIQRPSQKITPPKKDFVLDPLLQ
jgi:predicted small lipoprotein YifL